MTEERDDLGRDQYGRKEHEARLNRLVDPHLMSTDAYYHAQVQLFSSWLTQAEMAMEDEDVDPSVIRRILNRMVFGAPTGSESYERIGNEKVMLDMLMKATPQSLSK